MCPTALTVPVSCRCCLEAGDSSEDRFLYWGGTSGRAEAVRWGRWKAVRETPDRPLELFDLSSDIGEERDVAAENEEVVGEILAYLESAVTALPASE